MINVDIGKMNYDSRSFTSKLTVGIKILSESGEEIPGREVWKTDYLNCCVMWDMKPEYLGRRFLFNKKEVMLIGARPGAKLEIVLHSFHESRDLTAAADVVLRRILKQESLQPA